MSIDPAKKLNTYGKGKYLLRKAFETGHYLPEEFLWREKAAFSDAVGHSMVDYLKEYAEQHIQKKHLKPDAKNIRTLALSPKNLFSIVKFSKNTTRFRAK